MFNACPVCRSDEIETDIFVHENAFLSSATLERKPYVPAQLATVSLAQCRCCGAVFNRCFDEARMRAAYRSESYVVKRVLDGQMSTSLAHVAARIGAYLNRDFRVLEVGSGDGKLAVTLAGRCREMITVDPSYASLSCEGRADNMRHYNDYFNAEFCRDIGEVDVVVARHIFEHLTHPMDFLELVGQTLADSGILYVEVPNLEEIVDASRYYDIFNDHVGYYSRATLSRIAARAGFDERECISLFSDQHIGLFLAGGKASPSCCGRAEAYDLACFTGRSQEVNALIHDRTGGVAIYGAGAHGVTMWSHLDEQARGKVICYLDGDTSKAQLFLQGTDKQVCHPSEIELNDFDAIVLAVALYEPEVSEMLSRRGFKGQIIRTARRHEVDSICP